MSKFENTRSQKLVSFNCHKQKVVKDNSLLEDEYLEVEALETKVATEQSRATAAEIVESILLLAIPGRSHL